MKTPGMTLKDIKAMADESNKLFAENNRLLRALMDIAMADLVAWDKPEEFPAWAQQKAQEAVRLSLTEELEGAS